jgi:MFS family permease
VPESTPDDTKVSAPPAAVDASYLWVVKTPTFWALFFIVFALAFNHMSLIVHQNQYLVDRGFQPEFAAWMLGFSGILRSGGSIIWGWVSDRTWREISLTASAVLGALSIPFLIMAHVSMGAWPVVVFVLLMGLGYGGVSAVYAASAADLFHGPHFGKILGLLDIGFGLGAALGAYIAGALFDVFASYHLAFYMVLSLIVASIGGIWIAAPRRAQTSSGDRLGAVVPGVKGPSSGGATR